MENPENTKDTTSGLKVIKVNQITLILISSNTIPFPEDLDLPRASGTSRKHFGCSLQLLLARFHPGVDTNISIISLPETTGRLLIVGNLCKLSFVLTPAESGHGCVFSLFPGSACCQNAAECSRIQLEFTELSRTFDGLFDSSLASSTREIRQSRTGDMKVT